MPIPPKGIVLAEPDRSKLEAGLEKLSGEIGELRADLKSRHDLMELIPDVEVYANAVRTALTHDEFFNVREAAQMQ